MTGFEDLLPGEIASKRRPGPTPMRVSGVATSAGSSPASGSPVQPLPGLASAAANAASRAQALPEPLPTSPGPAEASVDGVPDNIVDAWFQLADADGDGRVADAEARDFFLTSGLAAADLSKIWKLVKAPDVIAREGKGLSRHRFAQVLRLIALAQSEEYPFTEENATAALYSSTWLRLHGQPLPPPRIASAKDTQLPKAVEAGSMPAAAPGDKPFTAGGGSSGIPAQAAAAAAAAHDSLPQAMGHQHLELLGAPQPELQAEADAADSASVAPSAAGCYVDDLSLGGVPAPPPAPYDFEDDDLFGLKALRERAASHGAATSIEEVAGVASAAGVAADGGTAAAAKAAVVRRMLRSGAVSQRSMLQVHTGELEAPVAVEVRLPPLQPKVSAKLTMLAAANGSLFAGPAVGGGLLQWGKAEDNLQRPEGQQGKPARLMSDLMQAYSVDSHVATEDSDAAPAIEVHTCDRSRTAACLLVDHAAQLLWVADKEGWVYAYDVSGEPSMSLRAGHRAFQFQAHRVGYVTAMCRTPLGELWTGSSRGNLRVWELGEPALLGDSPDPPRSRELRRGFGERAHNGPVLALTCPAEGQLLWSASSKAVLLWDAACGACLGMLQRWLSRPSMQLSQGDMSSVPSLELAALKYKIDSHKGLDTDPITGYVVARPPFSERPRIAAEQEAWAAQTDNNINELMERVSMGGSKVVQGAGKAVKLLGKLARGLGGNSGPAPAQDGPKAAAANRLPSSNSLARAGSALAPMLAEDEQSAALVGDIVALVAPTGGGIWVAHKCGAVDRYTAAGQRLGCSDCGPSITALACVGQHVWVGFSDGMISVRDEDGAALRVFQAHEAGILSIAQAGTRTYTLAANGSIKGWSSAVPHDVDAQALASWDEQACTTFQRESLRVLSVTWNVGESKPDVASPFFRWVHDAAFNTQLAVVGLQEIEMGSSSVALAAAKDAFSQKMQERGNTNAKFWSVGLLQALGGERHWHQVGLRQLSGMLVLVFARNQLRGSIGEVATASVACGVLGVGGNKGAVAVEFSVHRRKIAVVCSHFAAHQGAVEARNQNYATICRQLTFSRRAWYADDDLPQAAPPAASASMKAKAPQGQFLGAAVFDDGADGDSDADSVAGFGTLEPAATSSPTATTPPAEEVVQGEGMRAADMLVWLGDFNYRIDGSYEMVKEKAIRNELGPLMQLDQCRREMGEGRVFRGLREGPLSFRPTYKFDKGNENPFAYDTSDKRRVPAWCDRIFFRGTRPFPRPEPEEGETWEPLKDEDEVVVHALEYSCWTDVYDSDHKPVYAVLEVNLPITDYAKKREVCSHLLGECRAAVLAEVADAAVSLAPTHIKLHPSAMPRQMLLLQNEGPQPMLFAVSHEGSNTAAVGQHGSEEAAAQQLLEVRPVRGMVHPGGDQPLQVHLAGDDWALHGVQQPPDMRYLVRVGHEYSLGGASIAPGSTTLAFTASCLGQL